jgi:putative flippase GtrA
MSDTLEKAIHWSKSHQGRKLIRYSMVSVVSTIVSVVTLLLVFGVFRWWGQLGSTIFANAVAVIPSYYLNRYWAWGKSGRSHFRKEVLPFLLMAGLGIFVSIFGAIFARHLAIHYDLTHLQATVVVAVANLVSFGVFWVLKLLLFNRLFHQNEIDEFDEKLSEEEQTKKH